MREARTRNGARLNSGMFDEMIVDNFAGGGGASMGIEDALGRSVDIAINHDRQAVQMHQINHPHTRHLCEDVWAVDPVAVTAGRPVGLAWFSPDCKHFSRAKGGKPVEKKIRGLAWVAIRWAKRVRPRVIILENVREFADWGPLTADNRPCPIRKGLTFRRFVGTLRNLGYEVKHQTLDAADYGAPTHRKRLFLVARCDGQPIEWPKPTHGPDGKRNWRAAAECIDWSLPCPSIFERKRPLAEKTLRRIAMGLKRFVLDNPRPFIVTCNHGGHQFRGQDIGQPFRTVTGSRDAHGLVTPTLIQTGYGERDGQDPRSLNICKPLGTVVASGKHALVSAFLAKHYGGMVGHGPERPLGTVTAVDHHSVVAAHLTKLYGTNASGADATDPMPTVTAGGLHIGEVRAFLVKYYGTNIGHEASEPLQTITAKHRFGLVTIQGQDYQIVDIGLRMLEPRELARAQGFPDSYVLVGSKAAQVKAIGNSVCPPVAAAIVRANCADMAARRRREVVA